MMRAMFFWIVIYLMTSLYEIASSFFPDCKLFWGAYQVLDQLEFLPKPAVIF